MLKTAFENILAPMNVNKQQNLREKTIRCHLILCCPIAIKTVYFVQIIGEIRTQTKTTRDDKASELLAGRVKRAAQNILSGFSGLHVVVIYP